MGLRVVDHLQAMFDTTQKTIGFGEIVRSPVRDVAGGGQRIERRNGSTLPQFRLPAAPDELLRLRKEFDLADATAAEFDVVAGDGNGRAAALRMNLPLDRMNVLDRGKVEMLAPQERRQRGQEIAASVEIAGH